MNKLQQIVRLRQMLRKWRRKAQAAPRGGAGPVPAGHVAVYVGEERVRFVVRTAHLNHAIFEALLGRSQQEFGFAHAGALRIPCEPVFFEHLLSLLDSLPSPSSSTSAPQDADHLQELLDFYYSSYPPPAAPHAARTSPPPHHLLASPLARLASSA